MQFSITNSKIDRKWIFYGQYTLRFGNLPKHLYIVLCNDPGVLRNALGVLGNDPGVLRNIPDVLRNILGTLRNVEGVLCNVLTT